MKKMKAQSWLALGEIGCLFGGFYVNKSRQSRVGHYVKFVICYLFV